MTETPEDFNAFDIRTRKLLASPEALCNMVRRIALDAGEIIMKYYDGIEDLGVMHKDDDSPVTLADQKAEAHIEAALADLLPDVPMIGEEAVAAGRCPDISQSRYSWRVDALDGTKGFIAGEPNFTVNIALIDKDSPVLGVVYAPALGELYAGHGPGTALFWSEDTGKEKLITVRPPPKEGLCVVASRYHAQGEKLDSFLEQFKVAKMLRRDSSLKICTIAAGKADMYPRFGPTCEWDTAAADAVLRAAGGMITDVNGEILKYCGANPKWLNPQFVACSFEWFGGEEE